MTLKGYTGQPDPAGLQDYILLRGYKSRYNV
jgi:hypothetical protein